MNVLILQRYVFLFCVSVEVISVLSRNKVLIFKNGSGFDVSDNKLDIIDTLES